jgi:hypothetical protein
MRRLVLATSLTLFAINAFAAKPLPPSSFCVDDKCAADPVVQAQRVKWHPGHYMWLDRNNTSPEIRAMHMAQIDAIANEPTVRGVKLALYWSALETSQGDYSAGFKIIDEYLAKLKATNKYLILSVQDRQFGGYDPSPTGLSAFFPPYIISTYGTTKMTNGVTARIWQQGTMDRLIALSKALAARYNAHPNFEMYQVEETSIAVTQGVDGYSLVNYGTQIKRLLAASRPAWSQTIVRLPTNFYGNDTQMADLLNYSNTYNVAVGGPDVIPTEFIQADRVFMGGAGKDYRGTMAWVSEVQSPSLGGHEGTFTPSQLYTNGMQRSPSHFIWYRNTWSGGAEQKWDTGILPFIRSVKGATKTTCPTTYAGMCSS